MTNDNNIYVVKCNKDNFEDVHCMVKMFVRVLEADPVSCCIKASALDSCLKQRLTDTGASFWQEPAYAVARAAVGGRRL
jgi:hypothetical protein